MFDFPNSPELGTSVTAPDGSTRVWDGEKWRAAPRPAQQAVWASDTPPVNPADGQLWFDTANPQLYIWYNDGTSKQWVIVTSNAGGLSIDAPMDDVYYGRHNGLWDPVLALTGGNMISGTIGNIPTPVVGDQVVPKSYVDANAAGKAYADATFLPRAGGTMLSGTIGNIPTPVASGDAVPKTYVDGLVTGSVVSVGSWNASTNTPTLTSGNGTPVGSITGRALTVSVAGSTSIDGNATWVVGDAIVWGGTTWYRVPYGSTYALKDGTVITNAQSIGWAGGQTTGTLDPRIPDTVWAIQDVAGNITARMQSNGRTTWQVLDTANFTAATATIGTLTIGTNVVLPGPLSVASIIIAGDTYEAADPRMPGGISFALRDANGNIAFALDNTGAINTGPLQSKTLTLGTDPTTDMQAATKHYVDTTTPSGGPFLPVSGAVPMAGPLSLFGTPTSGLHAASKTYVDSKVGSSGGGLDPTLFALLEGPIFTAAPDVNDPGGYQGYKIEGQPVFSVPLATALGRMTLIGWQAGYGINDSAGGSTICIGFGSGGGAGAIAGGPGMTGAENTYVGWHAGAFCTTGNFNTSFGVNTIGKDDVGANLTALGNDAMRNPVGGNQATCVGSAVARDYVMIQSVAVGNSAMRGQANVGISRTTGSVAVGSQAMRGDNAVQPDFNTVVGFSCLQFVTSGTNNCTLGYLAGQNVTSGVGNILIGTDAGKLLTTGNYNTLIGPGVASSVLTTGSGNLHIGAGNATLVPGAAAESNVFRLGGHATNLLRAANINTATPAFFLDWLPASTSFASDAAAAGGGVAVGQIYRNGSVVQCRVA